MEIVITIPYLPCLSKNSSHRNIAINKRVPTKEYMETLTLIKGLVNKKLQGRKFDVAKYYIDIFVFRKDMKADPVNFVDGIADGVKEAIGIDDRWCAGSWDWALDKDNPRIVIRIRQGD